jgi:hypothetical protein
MRKFLKQYGGVEKGMAEDGKVGNHRKRATVWIIKPFLKQSPAVEKLQRAA